MSNAFHGLGLAESVWVVLSYLRWHLLPHHPEDSFEQWVTNRFGRRLFNTFFKSYTEKVWGIPCHELSAEWAAQRIMDLSLHSVLHNMFLRPSKKSRSLIEAFFYPRRGPGMMWRAVKAAIERAGGEVWLDSDVTTVRRHADDTWSVLVASNGQTTEVDGQAIISSMPVTELVQKLDPPPPVEVLEAAGQLTHRDFLTVCLIVRAPALFPDNWIYVHDPTVSVARIQNFKNWSPDMLVDPSKSTLGLEYFCTQGDALWDLPDEALIDLACRELEQIGLARRGDVEDGCVFRVPKAYPVYGTDYRRHLDVVRRFVAGLDRLQTAGRNGLHRYNNQDHAMLSGILAARNLINGERHDLWRISVEEECQEYAEVE